MTKGCTVWLKIGGSALLATGGLILVLSLNAGTTSADPLAPFVTTSSGATITVIPTPTLPARFTLLSSAFALSAASGNLTIAYD